MGRRIEPVGGSGLLGNLEHLKVPLLFFSDMPTGCHERPLSTRTRVKPFNTNILYRAPMMLGILTASMGMFSLLESTSEV